MLFEFDQALGLLAGLGVIVLVIGLVFGMAFAMLVNSYFLMKREGISLVHSLPLLAGLGTLLVYFFVFGNSLFFSSGQVFGNKPIFQVFFLLAVWYIGVVGYVGFNLAAYTLQAVIYGRWPRAPHYDAVVVLGSGIRGEIVTPLLASRLDRGIHLAREVGAKTFVCSGGQGPDEPIPEAEAMRRYVEKHASGEFTIYSEDRSTTTEENIRFSKALMDDELGADAEVAIVTSNYHSMRAGALARRLGVDWESYGAPTALYYVPTAFLREFVASMVFNWKFHAVLLGIFSVGMALIGGRGLY
ncbi:YdcF family protein [Corynebacterium silvaticum]|uniref:YdcF family protein n=1 Tax=Corynebacterium silvaticum TaxID=2320431 RepID=UPI001CEDC8C9|nr:YdcF family protein [Corynebacterium silvaticum]